MTDGSILIVCAANVCRSPLAELALRRGLRDGSALSVHSAGVRAHAGDPICTEVAARHADASWQEQTAAHRAREVTPEMLADATLVLAASRDIRGELVRMAPEFRDRMFTLREAAHLGEGFRSGGTDTVRDYVAFLDRARTRATPLGASADRGGRLRRLFGGRSGGDPASIADRHGSRGHTETIREVEQAVDALVGQLGGQRRHSS
ncbi:hypothetical protein [Microbacterium sp. BLY]|uniref:arsenate reductase/protein-tyrosine-phosphatase family protein n=1 Tax=Microbacterium sp. BLY TaxID=2823280 RepID=UPI001B321517|nr:hypothetical protein [Microbacterium sp. BLY]MBP3977353.1 hypothetical protein [Microbacterium sp. BLY]